MAAYVHEFEELSSQIFGVDDEMLEAIFLGGLQPTLKEIVHLREPRDLSHMIATVLQMEDGLMCKAMVPLIQYDNKRNKDHQYHPYRSNNNQRLGTTWRTKLLLLNSGQTHEKQLVKFGTQQDSQWFAARKYLSPAEYARKKKDGECYKCHQKYYHGHVCVNKELQVLTVIDGCEMELVEEEFFDTIEEESGKVTKLMELSFYTFFGLLS